MCQMQEGRVHAPRRQEAEELCEMQEHRLLQPGMSKARLEAPQERLRKVG